MSIITLATDFGTVDGYVGAVKGVIKNIAPHVDLIDITHDLDSISKAAIALSRYYDRFPKGTIHLVIVDPTVGPERLPLILTDSRFTYVGPDNGIFSWVLRAAEKIASYAIHPAKVKTGEISSTFHGRDIFAPAAAMLASGRTPHEIGVKLEKPRLLEFPKPIIESGYATGEIIDIDKFGNLITNLGMRIVKEFSTVIIEDKQSVPLGKTYSDVEIGKPVAYIGSTGYLEIAVNSDRADKYFGVEIGKKVGLSK